MDLVSLGMWGWRVLRDKLHALLPVLISSMEVLKTPILHQAVLS